MTYFCYSTNNPSAITIYVLELVKKHCHFLEIIFTLLNKTIFGISHFWRALHWRLSKETLNAIYGNEFMEGAGIEKVLSNVGKNVAIACHIEALRKSGKGVRINMAQRLCDAEF